MPALAAEIAVKQGWGSVELGASVFQVRYTNAMYDTDMGYSIGGKAVFNATDALTLGIAGGYSMGGNATGFGGATASAGTLNAFWAVSGGVKYKVNSAFSVAADAGIEAFDDRTAADADYKAWGASLKAEYKPVSNLSIAGKVGYRKVDFSAAHGGKDWDDYAAKLEIKRSF